MFSLQSWCSKVYVTARPLLPSTNVFFEFQIKQLIYFYNSLLSRKLLSIAVIKTSWTKTSAFVSKTTLGFLFILVFYFMILYFHPCFYYFTFNNILFSFGMMLRQVVLLYLSTFWMLLILVENLFFHKNIQNQIWTSNFGEIIKWNCIAIFSITLLRSITCVQHKMKRKAVYVKIYIFATKWRQFFKLKNAVYQDVNNS